MSCCHAGELAALLVLHLAEGAAGIGLGALVSPPLSKRPGLAVTVVVGYFMVALATPWPQPLRPVRLVLQCDPDPPVGVLLLLVLQVLALAVVLVGAALLLGRRRARE